MQALRSSCCASQVKPRNGGIHQNGAEAGVLLQQLSRKGLGQAAAAAGRGAASAPLAGSYEPGVMHSGLAGGLAQSLLLLLLLRTP